MLDAAIEAGVATFLAHRGEADGVVRASLEEAGVEAWLAQRLVAFLPIAFGRKLLSGASLSDELDEGGAVRPLAGEPVFAAALERAARAARAEVEAIGMRSAEVSAAGAALEAGSRLEDLDFSPVALVAPLAPAVEGDGGVPSPLAVFAGLLEAHGHPLAPPLAIDARVVAGTGADGVRARVDFAVAHPALAMPRLVESFATLAATWREAIGLSIHKFELSTFHPIVAALLDRESGGEQVTWETLDHPGGPFEVCLGSQLVLYAPEPVPALGPLIDALKAALRAVPLTRAVHAVRVYVCWKDGERIANEVLLDNRPWVAGSDEVARCDWPRAGGVWGTRLFFLIVPA
jgi:hypothetical protein